LVSIPAVEAESAFPLGYSLEILSKNPDSAGGKNEKKAKQDRRGCPASPTKEEKRKLQSLLANILPSKLL